MSHDPTNLFEVVTPLGFTVRTSPQYWQKVIAKRPDLVERLELINTSPKWNC